MIGVEVRDLEQHQDMRGTFTEIVRSDWNIKVAQANLSMSFPGVVRAWHRHLRGQIDYLVVLQGKVRVVVWDGFNFADMVFDGQKLQIVGILGHYWHGTKNIGDVTSATLYFSSELYDYDYPDEERLNPDDPSIPYDWGKA